MRREDFRGEEVEDKSGIQGGVGSVGGTSLFSTSAFVCLCIILRDDEDAKCVLARNMCRMGQDRK